MYSNLQIFKSGLDHYYPTAQNTKKSPTSDEILYEVPQLVGANAHESGAEILVEGWQTWSCPSGATGTDEGWIVYKNGKRVDSTRTWDVRLSPGTQALFGSGSHTYYTFYTTKKFIAQARVYNCGVYITQAVNELKHIARRINSAIWTAKNRLYYQPKYELRCAIQKVRKAIQKRQLVGKKVVCAPYWGTPIAEGIVQLDGMNNLCIKWVTNIYPDDDAFADDFKKSYPPGKVSYSVRERSNGYTLENHANAKLSFKEEK